MAEEELEDIIPLDEIPDDDGEVDEEESSYQGDLDYDPQEFGETPNGETVES